MFHLGHLFCFVAFIFSAFFFFFLWMLGLINHRELCQWKIKRKQTRIGASNLPPFCFWPPSSLKGNPAAWAPGTAGIRPSDRATASFQSSWRFAPLRWPGRRSYEKSEQGQKQRQDMLDTSRHTQINLNITDIWNRAQCHTHETGKCHFKRLQLLRHAFSMNWTERNYMMHT